MALGYLGLDVRAKLGDSRINSVRVIQLFGLPYPFYALLSSIYLHFVADWKQLVTNTRAKYRDPL